MGSRLRPFFVFLSVSCWNESSESQNELLDFGWMKEVSPGEILQNCTFVVNIILQREKITGSENYRKYYGSLRDRHPKFLKSIALRPLQKQKTSSLGPVGVQWPGRPASSFSAFEIACVGKGAGKAMLKPQRRPPEQHYNGCDLAVLQ